MARIRNSRVRGPGTPNPVPHVPMPENIPTVSTGPHGTNAQGYDPIHYGALGLKVGYAKVGQARNQAGYVPPSGAPVPPHTHTDPATGLPTLSSGVQDALQNYLHGPQYGVNAIPANEAQMRRFLRSAAAAGVGNQGLKAFLDPSFYRGVNDPNGGAGLLRYASQNFTPEQFKAAAQFARTNTNTVATGSNSVHNALTDAVPGFGDQYMTMANNYTNAPNVAHGMSEVPPGAVLGSDGKWHDPEMPVPAGVTLDPTSNPMAVPQDRWWGGGNNRFQGTGQFATDPNYMQNAQNRGPTPAAQQAASTQAAANTPEAAANLGKDPSKHLAYWHAQGWNQNPATGTWTGPSGATFTPPPPTQSGAAGGGSSPTANGQTGGTTPTGTGAGQLPLDAQYEADKRAAEMGLSSTLGPLAGETAQVQAQQQLALARLATDQGIDVNKLNENLAARGVFDSSMRATGYGDIATQYLRNQQDLSAQVASAFSDINNAAAGAYGTYAQQLAEALLADANRAATSTYTTLPTLATGRRTRTRGRGR